MTVFWVTLFFLHQGYSLVPVVTVGPGEPVTFTCTFTDTYQTITWLHWYKQSAGETMKVISMLRKNTNPNYGPGFSASRFNAAFNGFISILRILRTVKEDEGMYHCALMDWTQSIWNGTYLSVKGDTERTSSYTVVHQSMVSDPSGPADSETLQCSVLSEPQNKTCSGGLSVFWFRSRSDQSHPDIIYTDGDRPDRCETPDPQRRCSYKFSKNISSSDAGTYYCAVATCGQIFYGNGAKLENKKPLESESILLLVTVICLAISVIINIIFMCFQNQRSCKENSTPHDLSQSGNDATEDRQDLNYAALRFSGGKAPRGRKQRELKTEESVYSQVKGSV